MTVLQIIQRTTPYLAERGVDSPRLQIELMLAHVLQMPRLKLYLDHDRPVSESEITILRQLVKRRADREPLQHILGVTSFCGWDIMVNRHVLIPRPETELLAEKAWERVLQHSDDGRPPAVLDLGTGSGCLAIAVALKCPTAVVHASDISAEALVTARINAERHGLSDRITFYQGDAFQSLPPEGRYDVIVINPPYIPTSTIAKLEQEVRDYDPRAALDGGPDGLNLIRDIAAGALHFLHPDGTLLLEFGDNQEDAVHELFSRPAWRFESIEKDFSGRPRIVIARRPFS